MDAALREIIRVRTASLSGRDEHGIEKELNPPYLPPAHAGGSDLPNKPYTDSIAALVFRIRRNLLRDIAAGLVYGLFCAADEARP